MNSDEYEEIVNFIRKENYPEAAQVSRQKKWYYKRRLTPPISLENPTNSR